MQNHYAKIIWIFTLAVIGIGLVALYSASYDNVRVTQKVFFDQLIMGAAAVAIMWGISRVYYGRYFDWAYIIYGLNLALLIGVMVAGRHALGATRWINIGPISFQPSELSKIAIIFMLARYFAKRQSTFSFYSHSSLFKVVRDLIYPFILTVITMGLIFKQPDLGTALLIFGIFFVMMFCSGIQLKYFWTFTGMCIACIPFGWFFIKPYQKERLLVFMNPNIDPLGAGYTIIQSKIAVGSGQLLGKGWLSGTQNQLNFLPERHTDFIFSVIGEEWGLMGTWLTVFCFFMIIYAGLRVAEQMNDVFGRLLALGIISIFSLQVLINIGMVIGLCPVVGLTLPFMSYGRTSYLVFAVMIGILLNLSKKRSLF